MGNWDELVRVTALQYSKAQQGLAPILARETQLRSELAQLDAHDQAVRQGSATLTGVKAIGADVAWNSWLARKRRMLMTELAQVLAHKEMRMGQIRLAHARHDVAQLTAKSEAGARRTLRQQRELDEAVSLNVFQQLLNQ